jgi:hypothetical protein
MKFGELNNELARGGSEAAAALVELTDYSSLKKIVEQIFKFADYSQVHYLSMGYKLQNIR